MREDLEARTEVKECVDCGQIYEPPEWKPLTPSFIRASFPEFDKKYKVAKGFCPDYYQRFQQ